ncbi:RAD55 family ATPase [Bradyrhizobium sp. SZCCHNRI1029]|uniref:RAD55 family ATPase n=1 Tax=Bradyrhizobium sp. SZCCHNRI1029 TaxID=3057278 RepID=UPI0029170DDB|nr:ATPase domain-containing protein [Bradyrhizobium sp. SZCCHNRI1029]
MAVDYEDAEAFLYDLPFGTAGRLFYEKFYEVAGLFLNSDPARWDHLAEPVNKLYNDSFIGMWNRWDPHLSEGITANLRKYSDQPNSDPTRVFLILKHIFKSVLTEQARRTLNIRNPSQQPRHLLPSPLYFLRMYLTSPEFPASDAYAHAVVRAIIFAGAVRYYRKLNSDKSLRGQLLKSAPHGFPQRDDPIEIVRHFIGFEGIVDSVRSIDRHWKIRDINYPTNPTDFIVMHMLASRGMMHLSFPTFQSEMTPRKRRTEKQELRSSFLGRGSLLGEDGIYEFVIANNVEALPPASELVNEIDGLPIAIPNADIVFARGLRFTASEGTIMRITGPSGSGKTSLALGFATALAPLGIDTIYLSCEENPDDLQRRISTIVPEFIRRTRTFNKDNLWFEAKHLKEDADTDLNSINQLIDDLVDLRPNGSIDVSSRPPGIIPLLIVLDGIHELLETDRRTVSKGQETRRLRGLVENLRRAGALVIIMSADYDDPAVQDLDYVVDLVVDLSLEKNDDVSQPLVRKFILRKTRRQFARMGAHLLNLSPRVGVGLTPQIAAQRDMHRDYAWNNRNTGRWLDVFRSSSKRETFALKLYDHSQILITGKGSSGKASLALRLVAGGIVDDSSQRQQKTGDLFEAGTEPPSESDSTLSLLNALNMPDSKRRILVVSFLYQDAYYQGLLRNLRRRKVAPSSSPDLMVDVEFFYPGHLRPEDFLRRIISRIEASYLDGLVYDAIIVDGLHNVFMQFPRLQESTVLWPILYEMLRRYTMTVITTHTHIDMPGSSYSEHMALDLTVARERAGPVLQALVNAADFYFDVSASGDDRNEFRIETVNASEQTIPPHMVWDRSSLTISTKI